MPLYEYQCSSCSHRFELLQKFSDEPAKVCVRCGGPVVRLLSSPAIQFKGTGWYVTDYGGKKATPSEGKNEGRVDGTGEKSEKSSPASGETKPGTESPSNTTEKSAKS